MNPLGSDPDPCQQQAATNLLYRSELRRHVTAVKVSWQESAARRHDGRMNGEEKEMLPAATRAGATSNARASFMLQ